MMGYDKTELRRKEGRQGQKTKTEDVKTSRSVQSERNPRAGGAKEKQTEFRLKAKRPALPNISWDAIRQFPSRQPLLAEPLSSSAKENAPRAS